MQIEREAHAIRESVSLLEASATSVAEWRQFDARVFSAILEAQVQLVAEQRQIIEGVKAGDHNRTSWRASRVQAIIALLDELDLIRLGVRSRILELEASVRQKRGLVLGD